MNKILIIITFVFTIITAQDCCNAEQIAIDEYLASLGPIHDAVPVARSSSWTEDDSPRAELPSPRAGGVDEHRARPSGAGGTTNAGGGSASGAIAPASVASFRDDVSSAVMPPDDSTSSVGEHAAASAMVSDWGLCVLLKLPARLARRAAMLLERAGFSASPPAFFSTEGADAPLLFSLLKLSALNAPWTSMAGVGCADLAVGVGDVLQKSTCVELSTPRGAARRCWRGFSYGQACSFGTGVTVPNSAIANG